MPADTVKRAINKGTGAEAAAALEEVVYEGYGPSGVAMLVEAVTDSRNPYGSGYPIHLRQTRRQHGGVGLGFFLCLIKRV